MNNHVYFLGYSLIQLPDLIIRIYELLQKRLFSDHKTRQGKKFKARVTTMNTLNELEKKMENRQRIDDDMSDNFGTLIRELSSKMTLFNDRMDKYDKILDKLLNKQ